MPVDGDFGDEPSESIDRLLISTEFSCALRTLMHERGTVRSTGTEVVPILGDRSRH